MDKKDTGVTNFQDLEEEYTVQPIVSKPYEIVKYRTVNSKSGKLHSIKFNWTNTKGTII